MISRITTTPTCIPRINISWNRKLYKSLTAQTPNSSLSLCSWMVCTPPDHLAYSDFEHTTSHPKTQEHHPIVNRLQPIFSYNLWLLSHQTKRSCLSGSSQKSDTHDINEDRKKLGKSCSRIQRKAVLGDHLSFKCQIINIGLFSILFYVFQYNRIYY